MKSKLALILVLVVTAIAAFSPGMVTPASAASSSQKNVCVYYYGGWSSSVRDRIIATKPAFLVLDSSAGSFGGGPSSGDVALVQANGTKVFAYIFTGGMRGFLWDPTDASAPSNSYSAVIGFIDRVKSYGYAGVYFDEGGLYSPVSGQTYQNSVLDRYLASPGGIAGNPKYDFAMGETWKGKTVESYIGYAKSLGLLVCEGMDSYSSSNVKENIWPILDFVLTQENYSGSAPAGVEIAHASQCWVLSYNGAYSATDTNKAIGYGFGAAYDCASMGTLSSPAYENYMTAIIDTSPPSNLPPVLAAIGAKSVTAGQSLQFNVSATDPNGDTVTLSASGLPAGATFSSAHFAWTPAQAGSFNVTFTASDGSLTDSETVTITVLQVNLPPVLAAIGPKSVIVGQNLQFNLSATDPNGDTVTFSASGLPSGAILSSGHFSWTPTQSGSFNVTFTASDGSLTDSETVTITVTQANQPPVLASIGAKSIIVNQSLQFNVSATDPNGDTVTFSASGLPSGAILSSGHFSWTPTQAGSFNVTFTASDGSLSDSETVTITVLQANQPPVLAAIGAKSVTAGQSLQFNVSATDPNGDTVTLSASGLPAGATFSSAHFAWTPAQAGSFNVTFTASDGSLTDSETVTITVLQVNLPPVLAAIGPKSVIVGQNLQFNLSATDPNGDTVTFSASGLPSGAILSSGHFSWTPTQAGSFNVTFTASDGSLTDSETVTITVTQANQPPVLASIGAKSIIVNQSLQFNVSATDPNGDTVTFSASGLPSGAILSSGHFSWTPTQAGSFNVTFTASDGSLSDSETVTITVLQANQPPVLAAIGAKSVTAGQSLQFNVSATDPNGDTVTLSASGLPAGATFSSAHFAWTPTQAGSFNVTFTASDGSLTDSETVTITILSSGLVSTDVPQPQTGGGGGGGFGSQLVGIGISGTSPFMDGNGRAITSGQISTHDGRLTLVIPAGVAIWNAAGAAQPYLSETALVDPPQATTGQTILMAFEMGPNGVTFNPAITMIMTYSDDQMPGGALETDIYPAWWDGDQWIKIAAAVDPSANTVTMKVSHFTSFALLVPQPITPSEPVSVPVPTTTPENTAIQLISESMQLEIAPIYSNDGLTSINVNLHSKNIVATQQLELLLTVTFDGSKIYEVSCPINIGSNDLVFQYTPGNGWQNGTYGLMAQLEYGGDIVSSASNAILSSVVPPAPAQSEQAPTVSWKILGELIGIALSISLVLGISILVRYRRLNRHM